MRISIVGNGSIGTLTAIKLANEFPEAEITLIGDSERNWAASTAAGAMANVYAEMEFSNGYILETNRKYLEMGKRGSRAWLDFLELTGGMNSVTSPDTYVYLKKSHTEFEAQNYGALCCCA
jgi:glycine/D-amino acid oxidase-like deaminating enzyme